MGQTVQIQVISVWNSESIQKELKGKDDRHEGKPINSRAQPLRAFFCSFLLSRRAITERTPAEIRGSGAEFENRNTGSDGRN
jgi:hypothetical protein